jgi:hypothetical protein
LLVLREIGRRQSTGRLPIDQLGQQRRDPAGRRHRGNRLWGDRIERPAQATGIAGLVLGKQPAQNLTGGFVDKVDVGEIPAGVANPDGREVSVAVRHFEAVAFDHDGAIAPALGATVGLGEGKGIHELKTAIAAKLGISEDALQRYDELMDASNAVAELIHAGKLDEAEQAARDLLVRFPDVHDGYDRLAMVHEARGENRQAADCYRKVIAFIRQRPDDYDNAFEDVFIKRVAKLDPPPAT